MTMLTAGILSKLLALSLLLMGSPSKMAIKDLPLIPRKEIFNNPSFSNPQISPDGTQLAYLAPNEQGILNIWIRTLGKKDDRVITNDLNQGIHKYRWQYDNQHILFLKDKDGDENFHLFQINIQNKRTRDLTPYEKVQSRIVLYIPSNPNEIIIGLNQRDKRVHDVYLLNIQEGELTLLEENPGDIIQYGADNNLKIRVAIKSNEDGSFTFQGRLKDNDKWFPLFNNTVEDQYDEILSFSQDNRNFWMLTSHDSDTLRLVQMNLKTSQKTILYEHPTFDIHEVLFHPNKSTIQGVNYFGEYQIWDSIDTDFSKDIQFLQNNISGNINITSRDLSNETWIISANSDDSPSEFYIYEKSLKKLTHLFESYKNLKKYRLAKTWPFSFKAADGMKLYGYYTLPPVNKRRFPTIIYVHGGPWLRDTWKFQPRVQWLANRGYAVIQVNYRGSFGYGKKYLSASKKEWGNKMQNDLLDAKKWAIEQGITDSKKVAIMGSSYGGYAALVGLSFTPNEFCCGVSYVGPSNLVTLLKTIPPYLHTRIAFAKKFIGDVIREKDFLKERSPLFKVSRIKKPLFIAQGANDSQVSKAESDQIVQAMREKNKQVDYLLFPDEGHKFIKPINQLKCFAATEEFLAKYLGGRMENISQEEEWDELKN